MHNLVLNGSILLRSIWTILIKQKSPFEEAGWSEQIVKLQGLAKKPLKLIGKWWRRKLIEWISNLVTRVSFPWFKGDKLVRQILDRAWRWRKKKKNHKEREGSEHATPKHTTLACGLFWTKRMETQKFEKHFISLWTAEK